MHLRDRIPVYLVVNLVANGKPLEEILEEYPDLEPEEIRQSIEVILGGKSG